MPAPPPQTLTPPFLPSKYTDRIPHGMATCYWYNQYLLSDEIKKAAGGFQNGGTNPMYLGRRFRPKGNDERIFNSGGAAYVLNQASLGLLASHLDDPACHAHQKCFWEDVNVRRGCGVFCA